jgi:phosphohistidine phosphatase
MLALMLRLMILRHAKSDWAEPGRPDMDRPLAPRGERAAALMGAVLAGEEYRPDRILVSPARRTRETLAGVLAHLAPPPPVTTVAGLYEPAAGNYRSVIAANGGSAARLLLVGHNPASQATALLFAGKGERAALAELAAKYPTAALAVIDFEAGAWTEVAPRAGRLVAFLTPRAVARAGDDVGDD